MSSPNGVPTYRTPALHVGSPRYGYINEDDLCAHTTDQAQRNIGSHVWELLLKEAIAVPELSDQDSFVTLDPIAVPPTEGSLRIGEFFVPSPTDTSVNLLNLRSVHDMWGTGRLDTIEGIGDKAVAHLVDIIKHRARA